MKLRVITPILIVAMFAIVAIVTPARSQQAITAALSPPRPPGQVIPIFLCGSGADITQLGTNEQVRAEGWELTTRRMFAPRLREFWGGRAPAGARVIFHLPMGRSPVASGPASDMPFDGLNLAREAGLAKVADVKQLNRSLRVLQLEFGCEVAVYLGTVDHGHEAQWTAMEPAEFGAAIEAQLSPYIGVPNLRVFLDAGAVKGARSNSWQVRNAIGRLGLKVGSEPWPSIDGKVWADDPDCDFVCTSQLLKHVGDGWAVPRDQVRGRIIILDNEGLSDARIVALLRDGYDVAVGMYQVHRTAAEWTAAIIDATVKE